MILQQEQQSASDSKHELSDAVNCNVPYIINRYMGVRHRIADTFDPANDI